MFHKIKSIHFIGICGTAMASVAAELKQNGYRVTGSDENVYPPMSTFLEDNAIPVFQGFKASHVEEANPDIVVVGNIVSRGNPEAEYVLNHKIPYCSLPEILKGLVIQGKRSIVVAGTHGKTSTASLLTWVFEKSGLNPSYLIGGIPNNFSRGARFNDSPWIILEGDEYDTAFFDKRSKFVHYQPEIAIINHLEFDHADIFNDLASVQLAFERLIRLIPGNGLLLANGDAPHLDPILNVNYCPIKRFGLSERCDERAVNLKLQADTSSFSIGETEFQIPLVGELNVRNALVVALCARHCGLSDDQIQLAFDTFQGVKRRLEIRGEERGVTVIDDFGHHPTAIAETLKALRIRHPDRKIWAIFEPRSNTTRRRVFQKELAEAFQQADWAIIAEVARLHLLPEDERLSPDRLMVDIRNLGPQAEYLADADRIVEFIAPRAATGDILCVFSNGGFGGIHDKLLKALSETQPDS